jgi:excisionase family DNA binding protein
MKKSMSPCADQGQRLLVSYRDAGKMLGVCERSVWQLVSDRQLPKVTIGRSVRIPVTALDDFITRQLSQA